MSNDKDEQAVVIFTTIDCPFCGGEASLIEPINGRLRRFYVRCQGCWSQTTSFKRAEEAIAAWNTRSPSPAGAGTDASLLFIELLKWCPKCKGEGEVSEKMSGEYYAYSCDYCAAVRESIESLGVQPLPAPPQERTERG